MKSDKAPSDAEKCACCKQKMDLMEQFEFGSAEPENSGKMEAESTWVLYDLNSVTDIMYTYITNE